MLILLKFSASASLHLREEQLTTYVEELPQSEVVKKGEDIIYSAGTKKILKQLPSRSIQVTVDTACADNGRKSKSVRQEVMQIQVN